MRLALGVSYNGQGYLGWQSQPSGQTLQDRLEKALGEFCAEPVQTLCAGRTDAGVHALMQVVHLDTELRREPFSWVRGTNRYLPPDIAVQWAHYVPESFHARASATARRYVYVLLESPVRPALEAGRAGWVFRALDEAAMREAAAGPLKGVLAYTGDKVVSTDFRGCPQPSIFDAEAGIALDPTFVKVVAWYDNEYGYTCNLLRLVRHITR